MHKLLLPPRHPDVMSEKHLTSKSRITSSFHSTVNSSSWHNNSPDTVDSRSCNVKTSANHLLPFELFSSPLTVLQTSIGRSTRLSPASLASSSSSPLINVTSSSSPASLLVPSESQSTVLTNQSDTYICAAYNPRCFIIQKVRECFLSFFSSLLSLICYAFPLLLLLLLLIFRPLLFSHRNR